MKRLVNILAVLLLAVAVTAPAYARQHAPKGPEAPEVRKQEP